MHSIPTARRFGRAAASVLFATALFMVLSVGLGHALATTDAPNGDGPMREPVLDLTRHRGVIVEGEPGTRGNLGVSCPAGTVIGGGFSHLGSGLRVTESRPHGLTEWRVAWVQDGLDDTVLYAYAICMILAEDV